MATKMFVNYSGTLAAFKEAKSGETLLSDLYNKSIVFIGNGEAVYTHGKYYGDVKTALEALTTTVDGLKYFSAIKTVNGDTETMATATGKDGVITFSATDPASIAVNVDTKGVTIGLTQTFIDKVNNVVSGLAQEISDRTTADTKIRQDLGTTADIANAEGSAFARIALLKTDINSLTGGNGSVSTQITNAINALDVEAATGDYVAAVKQVDGKIEATMGTFNFDTAGAAATVKSEVIGASTDAATADTIYGAKKYADEVAATAQSNAVTAAATDATTKANTAETNAKGYADEKIAALDADVTSNATSGELENVVNHKVRVQVVETDGVITEVNVTESDIASAADLAAVKEDVEYFLGDALNKENAEAVKDTLKELQDYITNDESGASNMLASIQANTAAAAAAQSAADKAQGEVDALEGEVATVKATANAAATALTEEVNRAKAAEEANAAAIKAVSDDYLKASDKTELQNAITALETEHTNDEKVTSEALNDLNSKYAALAETDTTNLDTAKTYTDNAIAALAVADEVVTGQFVTAVSETDGKITVSRSPISASQIGITNTENDAFATETQNVQDALTELAAMWDWEEK